MTDNQRLLDRFMTEVCGEPAILVGNSMGGLIAVLQTSAHPEAVAGVVLIDPALPVGLSSRPDPFVAAMFRLYAVPAVGRSIVARRRSSRSAEDVALAVLRLCCVAPRESRAPSSSNTSSWPGCARATRTSTVSSSWPRAR